MADRIVCPALTPAPLPQAGEGELLGIQRTTFALSWEPPPHASSGPIAYSARHRRPGIAFLRRRWPPSENGWISGSCGVGTSSVRSSITTATSARAGGWPGSWPAEHGADVRLWVDQLASFARLCPAVSTDADQQHVGRIEIRRWRADFPQVEAADVVIEAFACELPESYIAAMARRTVAPAWINLEYLSAEDWVEGCHRLPSLRTKWPLTKYFFFPGFTPQTGGLLRERDLLADRARVRFGRRSGVLAQHGGAGPQRSRTASLDVLLRERVLARLASVLGRRARRRDRAGNAGAGRRAGGRLVRRAAGAGHAAAAVVADGLALPFLPQASFDRLLWACDVNFVRGEDSFVRAQWAGRPFVWQIYPQSGRRAPGQAGGVLGTISRWFRASRGRAAVLAGLEWPGRYRRGLAGFRRPAKGHRAAGQSLGKPS